MTENYKFNVRQMQAYAAICLWAFCRYYGIRHNSIELLIKHLMSILTTSNLPDWERKGSELAVTGRGDPLPIDVQEAVRQDNIELFNSLVETCVEVGIVDMYGGTTEQPKMFLDRCMTYIQRSGVELPSADYLSKFRRGDDSWGAAIEESELSDIMNAYGVLS